MDNEILKFKNYLAQLTSIDDKSFEMAAEYLKIEKIFRGDYLIKEGQICNKIAYIAEGLFRIYNLKDGLEINTCFCLENSITTSFSSFVYQVPSVESIQALEDSLVVTLSYGNLTKLQKASAKWQTIRQLFTEKECLRLSDRASSLSFESALEKYENLLKLQPDIIRRVSIQHIASYIGVSRETLSRIRSRI
ncbi:MAG: Crp/Fnr family transcriptional regulator [Bacteroidota bacterium]